jgi:hypothetical protein
VGGPSQFVGSERYRRDIPASDPRPDRVLFTGVELKEFTRRSQVLNEAGRGDQMRFILGRRGEALRKSPS